MRTRVVTETQSVERLLSAAVAATSPTSLSGWLSGPLEDILVRRVQDRFQAEGDDVSGAWRELTQTTLDIRAWQGFGPGPINVRTGEMRTWATSDSDVTPTVDGAMSRFPGEDPTGELLAKVTTAQVGKKRQGGQRPTPPRPILGVNHVDLELALTSLHGWLVTAITTGSAR